MTGLRLPVTHRADQVADRVRVTNRLRDVLSGYFPALEGEFDYSTRRGAVVLLAGYTRPGRDPGPRPFSPDDLASDANGPQRRAHRVGGCGGRQRGAPHDPGQDVAASIVAEIAAAALWQPDQCIRALDTQIGEPFHAHPGPRSSKRCL